MIKHNKQYWADYYGIDVNLPNEEFIKKIKEINQFAIEVAKKYEGKQTTCKKN